MTEEICYGDCFNRKIGIRIPAGRSHVHIGNNIKFVDVPKPLAQYLAEYIDQEIQGHNQSISVLPKEWLEQALDAYQSTENVTIKIERN